MNVTLYAYEGTERYELDLYSEEPIKITQSAEEITDPTQINSLFTRQFRIPATGPNSRFFKYWYVAGVADFDITQKVTAEIHVDGILYRTGQLRLQAVYINGSTDHIDLEVVFLGETRDFASQLGELNMSDLNLNDTAHVLSLDNIEDSWLDPSDPNLLVDGKVRWIVADRGNDYENGVMLPVPNASNPSEVSNGNTYSFTDAATPLHVSQFTPIVNVKYLIDKIFARTDYNYTSDSIFNDDLFAEYLYVDGIGIGIPFTPNSDARFNVQVQDIEPPTTPDDTIIIINGTPIPFDIINLNNSNAYNTQTYKFVAPVDGNYTFAWEVMGNAENDGNPGQPEPEAELILIKNGTTLDNDGTQTGVEGILNFFFQNTKTAALVAGDEVWIIMNFYDIDFTPLISSGTFECTLSPILVTPTDMMKTDLKMIDWLKSILTRFRLVMVPSLNDPLKFIIKPWKDYIASGNNFDWTRKLDYSKDIKIEPLFFNQAATIKFKDQEDGDIVNKLHQDTFSEVYGEREFISNNELLSQNKEIKTEFAPTPVDRLRGAAAGTNFIVPVFAQFGNGETTTGDGREITPLDIKQRLLYWNGLRNGGKTIYYSDGVVSRNSNVYPFASYLSEVPTTSTTLNLNWKIMFAYFQLSGGPQGETGQSVFDIYWNSYIENIYSPDARLLTAYFNLTSEDLRNLTFDDVIFIKDSYWRLQKMYDAPLGEVATVKCELVKLLDYVAP